MKNDIINFPSLILIGSTSRNTGKTILAQSIIKIFQDKITVIALKVTTAHNPSGACHRSGDGCGACQFATAFVLDEELDSASAKDTSRLLAAGASKVYWLRSKTSSLAEGFKAFLSLVPPGAVVVAESNSLREAVKPGCFIMLVDQNLKIKESAAKVLKMADIVIKNQGVLSPEAAQKVAEQLLVSANFLERTADQTQVGDNTVQSCNC